MNIQQAKTHFKLAYTVKDAAHTQNYGNAIIYSNTIKDSQTQITCKSNKGLVVLHDKTTHKTAEIIKYKADKNSLGERALLLIKEIIETANDNPMMMKNIVGHSILLEAKEIHRLNQ